MPAFTSALRVRFRWNCHFAIAAGLAALLIHQTAWAEEAVSKSVSSAPATHKQSQVVKVAKSTEGQKLEDFCIDRNGRILALLGPIDPNDPETLNEDEEGTTALGGLSRLLGSKKKKTFPHFASSVHVYGNDGTLTEQWPVGFSGQAINVAPDGTILVGGNGRVARFDANGKKLLEAESPQMTYIDANPDEMRERAKEQLQSDKEMYAGYVKQYEEQLKQVQESNKNKKGAKTPAKSKKSNDADSEDDDSEPQMTENQLTNYVQVYKNQLQMLEKKTVEQAVLEVTTRAKRINAIAGSQDDIFVTCPAMQGYGYGVWRTDLQFANAKEIVKKLSGCCGQMDVQCCNGELYVCENSRHRVIRFNREGKEVGKFGKRDRDGEGENFGSCCNPMNLCFNASGDLYVSESNGVVKHFTPDGTYKGIVGVAKVQPGCKNSCVGVTADDSRLFYIDIEKSNIIILARTEVASKAVNKQ